MKTYVFAGILGVSVIGVAVLLLSNIEHKNDSNDGLTSPTAPPIEIGNEIPQNHPQTNPMAQIQALRARLDQYPDDRDALMALGNAQMMINRFDEATKLYDHLLELEPKHLDARNNMALARLEQGRIPEAVKLLEENLKIAPDNGPALLNLGIIYLDSTKDQKKALETFKHYLETHPNEPESPQIRQTVEKIQIALAHPPR
ncbi:MAG TPA: tetratricopeptide repeat protein [Nitrospiria bacterium]